MLPGWVWGFLNYTIYLTNNKTLQQSTDDLLLLRSFGKIVKWLLLCVSEIDGSKFTQSKTEQTTIKQTNGPFFGFIQAFGKIVE